LLGANQRSEICVRAEPGRAEQTPPTPRCANEKRVLPRKWRGKLPGLCRENIKPVCSSPCLARARQFKDFKRMILDVQQAKPSEVFVPRIPVGAVPFWNGVDKLPVGVGRKAISCTRARFCRVLRSASLVRPPNFGKRAICPAPVAACV